MSENLKSNGDSFNPNQFIIGAKLHSVTNKTIQ